MFESFGDVAIDSQSKGNSLPSKLLNNNNHKRNQKSKENCFKSKCDKELKKKLRKYKLRRDGNEDPEVLDVSQSLVTSLRIKSPNNPCKISNNNYNIPGVEFPNSSNYLFKMVRKRKVCAQVEIDNRKNSRNISPISKDEDSQTNKQNVFKIMMDSRNKSIGSNSPGKEKCVDEVALEEISEKKLTKAKRMLSLQKMAENKGSLKNKEIENHREKIIKKKMLKRAELFKEMITKQDLVESKSNEKPSSDLNNIHDKTSKGIQNSKNVVQSNKILQLCDIFSDTNTIIDVSKQQAQQIMCDEDIEFLNKLSPSIRKKENMLSYFKKLPKEVESAESTANLSENNVSDEGSSVIKIKFTPKRKKKNIIKTIPDDSSTHSKYERKQNDESVICDTKGNSNLEHIDSNENRKRKRNKKIEENKSAHTIETETNIQSSNENRPKRSTKKPIKYMEDVHCFSSDEELHIFTPKKKRNGENSKLKSNKNVIDCNLKLDQYEPLSVKDTELKLNNKNKIKSDANKSGKIESKKNSNKVDKKKQVKLAPIFVAKPQLTLEALEAKQKFLQSGVPEKLKKNMVPQSINVTSEDTFNAVVHVQQNCTVIDNYTGKNWFSYSNDLEDPRDIGNNYSFKSLITVVNTDTPNFSISKIKPDKVLKHIKNSYPKFPVYRTFHRLRGKSKGDFKETNCNSFDNSIEIIDNCNEVNNDNPEKLNWCDKYKSTSSKQIIGNFDSIKELKRWLETWNEKLIKVKTNSEASDMSDFYCSDFDSRDSMKTANNVLILTGKSGSGKTSSVYAVATELAIKVIEVNASSKRNGKIMLQDLQEATQSHKVDRAKSNSDSSQKSQEAPLTYAKRRGRPKKNQEILKSNRNVSSNKPKESLSQPSPSQDCIRTGMSLILVDDADIVFDQDDGFCSAITQLINSSKRPVILVTSSLSCPHLQKFIQNGKILHMRPLLPKMLGAWLDIMCLADVGKCYMGLGEKILDNYRGDIRKTINCLQFFMNSYRKSSNVEDLTMSQVKCHIYDESSSSSWADDTENLETIMPVNNESSSIDKHLQSLKSSASKILDVWWGLSNYYRIYKEEKSQSKNEKIAKLADVLNTISSTDCYNLKYDSRTNVMSKPWHCNESASLLEAENFDDYNEAYCLSTDIVDVLLSSSISEACTVLKAEKTVIKPSIGLYRERDRLVSRHNTLSSYLNPAAILDRRATALDYWSYCRTFCRIEKTKTDVNMKRNNRFCHYLKSLNVLCKNEFFDNLADSLT